MIVSADFVHTRLFVVLFTLVAMACSAPDTPPVGSAPPTPSMPASWKVVSDIDFDPADIRPVAASLGAEVTALRNTTYQVGADRIKVNTIVAASSQDADAIMMALEGIKSKEFFLRKGLVIYELVGPDAAIPEMRQARERLGGL